jgi:hypothetical protein
MIFIFGGRTTTPDDEAGQDRIDSGLLIPFGSPSHLPNHRFDPWSRCRVVGFFILLDFYGFEIIQNIIGG